MCPLIIHNYAQKSPQGDVDYDALFTPENASFLCFAVHLYLYFHYHSAPRFEAEHPMLEDDNRDALVLVRCYITYLIRLKQYESMIIYCRYLPRNERIEQYALFLTSLAASDRAEYLAKAKEAFPEDVMDISRALMDKINNGGSTITEAIAGTTSRAGWSDNDKIQAVLCFFDQCFEADSSKQTFREGMQRANKLFRFFVGLDTTSGGGGGGGMELASALKDLPLSALKETKLFRVSGCEREFLSWQDYFKCHGDYAQWSAHFYRKPQYIGPASITGSPDSLTLAQQKAVAEARTTFKNDFKQWNDIHKRLYRNALSHFTATLTRAGGFLNNNDLPEDEQELEPLKRKCVPELVVLMNRMATQTEDHQKSVELADLIADEDHQVATITLVDSVRESMGLAKQSKFHFLCPPLPSVSLTFSRIFKHQCARIPERSLKTLAYIFSCTRGFPRKKSKASYRQFARLT